jgi:glycerol-3-phosphate dehydrogenase
LRFGSAQVLATWQLYGTQTEPVLAAFPEDKASLAGTDLPWAVARYSIRHEWVRSLSDLVERRLMLLYHRRLCEQALRQAAEIMAQEGVIAHNQVQEQTSACIARLQSRFGKRVETG